MRTKERTRNTLSFQKYTLHLLSVTISLQLKDGKEAIQKRVDLSISLSEEKCITFRFHRDVNTSTMQLIRAKLRYIRAAIINISKF